MYLGHILDSMMCGQVKLGEHLRRSHLLCLPINCCMLVMLLIDRTYGKEEDYAAYAVGLCIGGKCMTTAPLADLSQLDQFTCLGLTGETEQHSAKGCWRHSSLQAAC